VAKEVLISEVTPLRGIPPSKNLSTFSYLNRMKQTLLSAIIWAGLLAGTLDIIAACGLFSIRTGQDPIIVLRFVASGALGVKAMTGGWTSALMGLLFHYIIAFSWTTLFFLVFPKLPNGSWILYGLLYGIVVWLIMNLAVLPLTRITPRPFSWNGAITGTIVLMVAIGLPISYLANKFYGR
jgi:uncharacterized membrane protein YagU involved in acid resistance